MPVPRCMCLLLLQVLPADIPDHCSSGDFRLSNETQDIVSALFSVADCLPCNKLKHWCGRQAKGRNRESRRYKALSLRKLERIYVASAMEMVLKHPHFYLACRLGLFCSVGEFKKGELNRTLVHVEFKDGKMKEFSLSQNKETKGSFQDQKWEYRWSYSSCIVGLNGF